jgi:serine/threonine-protein kinase
MLVGQRFGPFIIDKELGSGAMGTVYRATYEKTGQRVALKVMVPGLSGSEHAQARFEREGEILKQLNHPNIVRLFGVGRSHGMRFYAMEYIKGEGLDKVIQRRGRLTWEEVVALGQQLCAALQHAHEQGIIHRDIKPSNLMMLLDGSVKLTDFGIAKDLDVTQLTAANCTVGTASYMSPEQCRGDKNMNFKSDLYSLGVVFYELLTGKKPFNAEVPMDMFLQHIQGAFERPSRLAMDIPVWLDTLVCQMLEKKPEKRPRDAAAVAEALNRIAEKVTAQQSAGVDLVQSRAIDRPRGARLADEEEREAARSLHEAVTGKKLKRRRGAPFYQRAWFIVVGSVGILAVMAALLYIALKPPSPEALYLRAEKLMASTDPDDWDRARDGPIMEYLSRYARRNDEQAAKIREWAAEYDVRMRARQLANRMKMNLQPQDDAERAAQAAVRHEEAGDLAAAQKSWATVLEVTEGAGPDQQSWALLADKRLREVREVDVRLTRLFESVEKARQQGRPYQLPDELEQLAARAAHFESFGDQPSAFAVWTELRVRTADLKKNERFWTLLNAKKSLEQKSIDPPYKGKEGQVEWLKSRLAKAGDLEPPQAHLLYLDIVMLYHDVPHLAEIVQEAMKRFDGAADRDGP